MKGKLISTYLSKMKKIPNDAVIVIIMDNPPFDVAKYPSFKWFRDLAPYEDMRKGLKDGSVGWSTFSRSYISKLQDNPFCNEKIGEIISYINAGKDVYIICCEKDYKHCHRYLLGQFIEEDYDVCYKEME